MEQKEFYKELVNRYVSNTATENELEAFFHLLKEGKLDTYLTDKMIEEASEKEIKPASVRRMPKWGIIAAASAMFFLLAGIFYLMRSGPAQNDIVKTTRPLSPSKNDIAPGGNKAVLTLADGSTIILDSAQNGTLSNQGNIKIIKLNDGQLAYDKSTGENKGEMLYNTISTPKGGQYQLILSDGSRVWLNAASSLRFPATFSGSERKVELTGEGYFEVAKNKEKPFRVFITLGLSEPEGAMVEVLGTHFNVNAYNDEPAIKTTLLEGMVKVSSPVLAGNSSSKFLRPGQQAGINKNGEITVADNADTEEAVAWKNGLFQFKSADIKTVLRQIARWYDVEVEYTGNVNLHFTGQLTRNANVSNVFKELALTGEVHFKIDNNKIIVSP